MKVSQLACHVYNLFEEGAIGAEEAIWSKPVSLLDADMKNLIFCELFCFLRVIVQT